ncbi:MAG: phenylalanine--tRNA ligase subunit beta [Candidatus Woesearchaeota archaeon]
MPTISVEKDTFIRLVGAKLSDEELKERISMLGTDLEKIEGNEIVVEVFPNRPDMLSLQGFARAFSSFIGKSPGLKRFPVSSSNYEVIVEKNVAEVRPYTVCAVVKGIRYDDKKIKEVIMIQEKLHITYGRNRRKVAIGIYPFEKIRLPITFKAMLPEDIRFQPLEFPRVINGKQILSMHPTGREYAHLLAGKDRYPVFVDANGEILSMPPIINSHKTGKIGYDTTDVFIECSGFDLSVLEKSLNMIVCAMHEMGGEIYSMRIHYPDKTIVTPNLEPSQHDIDLKYINKRLGLNINEKELKHLLERMGFGYENKKVLVPAYRADILHQIDFAEDIAIAYGYENFEGIIPNFATVGEEDKFEVFKSKIADSLAWLGFCEVHTYCLTNKDFQTRLMNHNIECIELANSISHEYNVLRAWVIPSLLEVLKNNKHNEYPQNIFGYGVVFKKNEKEETGIEENERLCVALCNENADYTRARQVLDYIFRSIDVKYTVEEIEHPSFIPGRVARIFVKNKGIAYIGEIAPDILSNWQLEMPVAVFELNISELFNLV